MTFSQAPAGWRREKVWAAITDELVGAFYVNSEPKFK